MHKPYQRRFEHRNSRGPAQRRLLADYQAVRARILLLIKHDVFRNDACTSSQFLKGAIAHEAHELGWTTHGGSHRIDRSLLWMTQCTWSPSSVHLAWVLEFYFRNRKRVLSSWSIQISCARKAQYVEWFLAETWLLLFATGTLNFFIAYHPFYPFMVPFLTWIWHCNTALVFWFFGGINAKNRHFRRLPIIPFKMAFQKMLSPESKEGNLFNHLGIIQWLRKTTDSVTPKTWTAVTCICRSR